MTTCSLLPVASDLHDHVAVDKVLSALRPSLMAAGMEFIEAVEAAETSRPFAVLVLTGGSEAKVLAAWRARQQLVPGEPLLLVTHAGHNSLPAALEALARLRRDGARARIVMVQPDDVANGNGHSVRNAVHDIAVWHALHASRLGVLGDPSEWLVASIPNDAAVTQRWGTTLVRTPLRPVIDRFEDNIDAPIAEPVRVRARHHRHEPHPADVETAARFEPVLSDVVAEQRLDAVTVRCFDLVTDAYTSGCLALSALNDRGVVAGCEGDVASAMALLWLRHLLGRIGWMANPSAIHESTGVIELAHCTVPLSLTDGYELQTHFESGIGVGIAGTFPPGPVTVVRLGGDELEQLWCADGEALPTTPRPGRCRTQVDISVAPERAGELLTAPLGNHLVVVPGHHAQEIVAWWREMIAD